MLDHRHHGPEIRSFSRSGPCSWVRRRQGRLASRDGLTLDLGETLAALSVSSAEAARDLVGLQT